MARKKKQLTPELAIIKDPVEAAKVAHLRYVNDSLPGITRQRRGQGFSYYDANGHLITDKAERERIDAMVIPPAWTEVWICPNPNGHILATGRDEKGRKQYIYHPRWREIRDQTKFNRMILFGETLPKIRQQTDSDLRRHGLPREKVVAAVLRLLESTLIRIGNEEYARNNESYGLTTLQDDHVNVSGSSIRFEFVGKSGKEHAVNLQDRRLAKVVKQCQEIPGQELFQYYDENGNTQVIDSGDVNTYLHQITGEDFSAKDFRTWGGTVLALKLLMQIGPSETQTATKRNISQTIKQVAAELGNTVSVCRKYYVHPAVLDCYTNQSLPTQMLPADEDPYGLSAEEHTTVEFLRQCALNP